VRPRREIISLKECRYLSIEKSPLKVMKTAVTLPKRRWTDKKMRYVVVEITKQ